MGSLIAQDHLEELVDQHGLDRVVEMLADICADKADHLRSNWQDDATARAWDTNGWLLRRTRLQPTV